MNKYVVGLDGGGTKTAVEIRFPGGGVPLRAAFGPINLNGSSEEAVKKTLCDCFEFLSGLPGGLSSCSAVCLGGAGVSNSAAAAFWRTTMADLGYGGPLALVGDHETALTGAHGGGDGAILIAGTGSICYGSAAGRTCRAGGCGHIIDDEGGGYAIGRDILKACVRALDGRAEKTMLTALVFRLLSAKCIEDIVRFVYSPDTDKKAMAALAVLLPEAVRAGDAAAIAIVEECGRELAALVRPVIETLSLQCGRLSLLGGVLIHDTAVQAAAESRIRHLFPNLLVSPPMSDAASGAAIIAEKLL